MYQLEKFHGSKSRHTCPACGKPREFALYLDQKGEPVAAHVGRCNRESNCGYHFTPKMFFDENPELARAGESHISKTSHTVTPKTKAPDYIDFDYLKLTLTNYEQNAFVRFLLDLFPGDSDLVENVLKDYYVGTFQDFTCFPYIDRSNRICRAKLIRFDAITGKRLKGDYDTSSLVTKLKIKRNFEYAQIFFGEHLLTKYQSAPVAIVEAEKTAIIARLCFPGFVWLAAGSKSWLKADRLKTLENRTIILYPDADGFDLWQKIACDARAHNLNIKVSRLIENHATTHEKSNGYDLADYLVSEQTAINLYNSKLDKVLSDEKLISELERAFGVQRFDLMHRDKLPAREIEAKIFEPGNIRATVLKIAERRF